MAPRRFHTVTRRTEILEVRVDEQRRLCVMPDGEDFALIYRAAAGVHWDKASGFLHSTVPREWSYSRWFQQIAEAVRDEYGHWLSLSARTRWINVGDADRRAMEAFTLRPRSGTA